MKAKALMTPLYEFLRPDDTLKDASLKLRSAGGDVKGLPVLDSAGSMVGFLSIWDILKAVFPPYMSFMDLGDFTWDGMVEEMAGEVKNVLVSERMAKDVISVMEDAPLMECVDHMLKHDVRKLPVTDSGGRVVGMLYERDVFYAIVDSMLDGRGPK